MPRMILALFLVCCCSYASAEISQQHPVDVMPVHRSPPNPTCERPCNRTAVIFVHGFRGELTTWRYSDGIEWPKLLADDPELGPDIDVYRLEYLSRLNQGLSVPHVSEIINEQLDRKFFGELPDPRPPMGYSKIVMVCHSLGGILCRNYMLHVKLRWGHQFLSLIRATITLGTPLNGADLANFRILRATIRNEQLRVLRPQDVNDFLQLLNNSTRELQLKHNYLNCPRILLYAGYEMHDTPAIEGTPAPKYRVVPEESAAPLSDPPLAGREGFEMDHRELARPANRDALQYKWVADILQACKSNGAACGAPATEDCGRPPWLVQRQQ